MSVIDRFLRYVEFETTSNENSESIPSTENQTVLADYLVKELKSIGVSDAYRDKYGYVYGHIPATKGFEKLPKIGLISHMDTSPDVSGKDVKAKIIKFDGTNAPMIDAKYSGEDIIVTDRTTLLGTDDKAGVAEIIEACREICDDAELCHGKISICFTPDEEIGRGADKFDFETFDADFAYTVDGGELGGIEYENFNAAGAKITFNGVNTHPGTAKNKMKNAVLYLAEFINMLPAAETPAHTENREGFYHVSSVNGNESKATLHMIIRDHNKQSFAKRKEFITVLVEFFNRKYGENTVSAEIKDSYYNMREKVIEHPHVLDIAQQAMRDCDIEPVLKPIRGGTDGAQLSFMGLPCPNLFTGGYNYHGKHEFVTLEGMEKAVQVIVRIAELTAQRK